MPTIIYATSPGWEFHNNHESGQSWTTLHDATDCSYSGNYGTTTNFYSRCYHGNGNSYDIYRSTCAFDTSSIPSNATISSVIFNAYRKKEWAPLGYGYEYLCPVSATGNATGYYAQSYFGTVVATLTANGNSDNTNLWWQPSIDVSSIVKAGTTYFGLRTWFDYNNSAPGITDNTNQFYFADLNDVTYKPYLTVTWTTPPAVTTGDVTNLQPISVTLGGNITDTGGGTISTAGVCWATSINPTTSSSKTATDTTSGAFTISATGLLPGTLYHYRAYVTTENSTQYSSDLTFRTPGGAILFNLL